MQPQKLCLKWNNHTTNLLAVLGSFQQKDILVDVTISCEGQNIKAHKMVLSACSPYFQSIFLENPCKHPVIIINGIKFEDITAILNFMYKGEVNVSQDGLSSFLQAAEALKVKGLAEVCGEKKSTNSMNQEVQQSEQNRPQRTDTPPRKRHRNRKRSLSDSNRSDDEGTARKHREHSSPEIHELSGDESFTGDNTSNGPPYNSVPRVPQNVYSRSHQSSSNLGGEEDEDFEVEPSKLLEQTLTTENVSMNNSNSDNNLRIERIMGNATEMESSSMQEPESPPDIKPVIDYGESGAGTSEGNLMLYSDQSQPGPSSVQDSLLHDSSHTQAVQKCTCEERMVKLAWNLQEQLKRQSELCANLLSVNSKKAKKQVPKDLPIKLPATTHEELQFFEGYLENGVAFNKSVQYFSRFGGSNIKEIVRRIMKNMMTDQLGVEYNMKGRGTKNAFENYENICSLIFQASFTNPFADDITEHKIRESLQDWLKQSKFRMFGKKNKTGPTAESETSLALNPSPVEQQ